MKKINFLRLPSWPIQKQLELEEGLLRADEENWCLVNRGSPPAIVMGISGKADHLIDLNLLRSNPIPVIRRFSGGGTVIVDENTYFITLICNAEHVEVPCRPDLIVQWTDHLYRPAFKDHPFRIIENDYAFGDRKFGGNAQYLRKTRFLHHTSFLWDFHEEKMGYLLHPKKTPAYREERHHLDFLCKLKDFVKSLEHFEESFEKSLKELFEVQNASIDGALAILGRPHRKATEIVELKRLLRGSENEAINHSSKGGAASQGRKS